MTMQKWGGLASFLLPAGFLVAPLIYLVGDLRNPLGPLGYALADFLYGPVWAASLITAVFALRERSGERASNRMALALLAAVLAGGAMVLVACIRAANRQYHLGHPELQLEESIPVLVVWTTIVAGITAAGWHFLGWALLLLGSAAWTTALLPRCSVRPLPGRRHRRTVRLRVPRPRRRRRPPRRAVGRLAGHHPVAERANRDTRAIRGGSNVRHFQEVPHFLEVSAGKCQPTGNRLQPVWRCPSTEFIRYAFSPPPQSPPPDPPTNPPHPRSPRSTAAAKAADAPGPEWPPAAPSSIPQPPGWSHAG